VKSGLWWRNWYSAFHFPLSVFASLATPSLTILAILLLPARGRGIAHAAEQFLLDLGGQVRGCISSDLELAAQIAPDVVQPVGQDLAAVERAFRSLKSIDLRVRPIHHRLADRVRSHIVLCMLAYYIEHQVRELLAGLMFVDEDKSPAETRDSIVSCAPRSESAKHKDATRFNAAGFRLSRFRDLLESLSMVTRSVVTIELTFRTSRFHFL